MDLTSAELRSIVQEELRRSPMSVLVRQLQGLAPLMGSGSPEGVVTGGVGTEYIDTATGLRWTHEVATVSDTGWVVK